MCSLALISAACLIFSAGAQNVSYGWQLGAVQSPFKATVLALASAGATLLAPVCFAAVMICVRKRSFGVSLVALALGTLALTYAAVCSLGTVAGARNLNESERLQISDRYADQRAVAAAARAELATLKGQTPAVLKRRRELVALLTDPRTGRTAAPVQADAQATALAFYIRAAGWHVEDSAVSTWLGLFMVMFLEAGAALSLTVAAALRPTPRQQPLGAPAAPSEAAAPAEPKKPATGQEKRPGDDADDDQPPAPPRRGKPGRPRDVLPAQAIEKIRVAGGKANGSITGLAKLIGSRSKTSCHRLLHELVAAGAITMTAGPRGVAVAVA
jgi:hypothetical protein